MNHTDIESTTGFDKIRNDIESMAPVLGILGWRCNFREQEICSSHYQTQTRLCLRQHFPMCVNQHMVGVLELLLKNPITRETSVALQGLANLCAASLLGSEQYHKAMIDPLTQLYSRHALSDYMDQRVESGQLAVVCVVDVNNFKAINDTHGHPRGDAALKRIATELKHCCRTKDLPYRPGGDEFVLVLQEIPERYLERVQYCLAKRLNSVLKKLHPLSFSFGITAGELMHLQALIETADDLMYQHKKGRPQDGSLLFTGHLPEGDRDPV